MIEHIKSKNIQVVTVGTKDNSLEEILLVATGRAHVEISQDPSFLAAMEKSQKHLHAALERGEAIYGVTTGYGGSCGNRVDRQYIDNLGANLIRYHGCGTGETFGISEVRAAMLCRMICLSRGYSGITTGLLEQMAALLNEGITPCVPCEGSVGASGDLTPMSYIAAALAGDRDVFYQGKRMPSAKALQAAGITPYRFEPKEPLAVLNGTSVMTGIAVLTVEQSRNILEAITCATALSVHGIAGHAHHFHKTTHRVKAFPGQNDVALRLRELLASDGTPPESDAPESLQDPYSTRCTPHVLGVLADALTWITQWVQTEAVSVNDNPILEPDTGQVLVGGNFYGGHMAFAMDALKAAIANAADLSDRQLALLVDARFNRGLPGNLIAGKGDDNTTHHGFKGLQITASALTAEALKLTMPASVFSRSTESHNQDKVSMGTIAARDAARLCILTARVAAIHLMAAAQACRLRGMVETRPALAKIIADLETLSPPNTVDRPMDQDVEAVAVAILDGTLFQADADD